VLRGAGGVSSEQSTARAAFLVGATLGALATAVVLLLPTRLLDLAVPLDVRMALAAALVAGLAVVELTGRAGSLPQNRRQVPSAQVRADRILGPMSFGFEMGTSVRTFNTTVGPYLVLAVVALGAPLVVLAAGLGFGLSRGIVPYLPLVTTSIRGVRRISLIVAFACATALVLTNL
jgi:hypothetical protein